MASKLQNTFALLGVFRYKRAIKADKKIKKLKKQLLSILKDCLKNEPEPTVSPTVTTTSPGTVTTTSSTTVTTTSPATVTTTSAATVATTHSPVGGKWSKRIIS